MEWREVAAHTTTEGQDIVGELFMRFGASGVEIIDRADVPDPSKPGVYWELYDEKLLGAMPEDVLVKGWFAMGPDTMETLRALKNELERLKALDTGVPLGELTLDVKTVADADWAENWKKYYKPFRVGERLMIKPSWESCEAGEGDIVIELDPGMAFGTGTHETTHMCLELLEKHIKPGDSVMDIGTGSGILAIAAARLGASRVMAIDIDPDAVKVARENIERCGVSGTVRALLGDLVKGESMPCNLAVANIVADAVCMLAAPLTRHLAKGGVFICSGIIRQRERDVVREAESAGYALIERREKGEWVALALENGKCTAAI